LLADQLLPVPAAAGLWAHPMPVGRKALAGDEYTDALRRICGRPPVLDIVHVGLGADGHTASLFAGDPGSTETDRDVAWSGSHGRYRRLTMTHPLLARSRRITWLVTGTDKAVALRRLLEGAAAPSGRLRRHGDVVVADRAADEGEG